MTFDSKKALEAWKKAKPLLLTDTGVSDFLRKLPADAKSKTYLTDLAKAKSGLATFMADKKIKAEKKALACLTQIQDDIDEHLAFVKSNRKHVLGDMENIRDAAKAYFAEAIKNPTLETLLKAWTRVMLADRGSRVGAMASIEHAADPALQALVVAWNSAARVLDDANTSLLKLLKVHAASPLPDFKARLLKSVKQFGDAITGLDKVRQAVKGVQL